MWSSLVSLLCPSPVDMRRRWNSKLTLKVWPVINGSCRRWWIVLTVAVGSSVAEPWRESEKDERNVQCSVKASVTIWVGVTHLNTLDNRAQANDPIPFINHMSPEYYSDPFHFRIGPTPFHVRFIRSSISCDHCYVYCDNGAEGRQTLHISLGVKIKDQ